MDTPHPHPSMGTPHPHPSMGTPHPHPSWRPLIQTLTPNLMITALIVTVTPLIPGCTWTGPRTIVTTRVQAGSPRSHGGGGNLAVSGAGLISSPSVAR